MQSTDQLSPVSPREALATGMTLALHARNRPGDAAVLSPHGDRTLGELNAAANRLARALRARGLRAGDAVALVCSNRPEFLEVYYACLRSGLRLTPINWHLGGEEIAYIVSDCEARALVADARFAGSLHDAVGRLDGAAPVRLAVAGDLDGFEDYAGALAGEAPDDLDDPVVGTQMLYTSGTTGRPKGVHRKRAAGRALGEVGRRVVHKPGEDLNLCTGPLYHAAPLAFSMSIPLLYGVGVVLMDGWDAREALRLIERHRVSHTHMVPTMFHRMLALPEEVRAAHDLASLRVVLHGAAPCPVDVKRALIEWLGPVVFEYYAATEGWGAFITPEEWLAHPGSVGVPEPGQVQVRDEEGRPLGPGEIGLLYLKAPEDDTRFEYFKDGAKTGGAYDEAGAYFTLGDMGYLDEDGYLYLADRSADVIISGGVNIYPAEVDAALLTHPAVADACCVGAPNDEWGEEVRAVVQLEAGVAPDQAIAAELVEHCRARLAHYKCPRRVEFAESLPRLDSGKIQRRKLRDRYWEGRAKRI
jgi:long-chain acyl-CoA synthetase